MTPQFQLLDPPVTDDQRRPLAAGGHPEDRLQLLTVAQISGDDGMGENRPLYDATHCPCSVQLFVKPLAFT